MVLLSYKLKHLPMLLAILIIVPLVTFLFYINALRKTLAVIDPEMRVQAPGLAWLLLIPIFNVIWFFFLLRAIRDGFDRMAAAGRLIKNVDTGYGMGLAMGCCWAAMLIPRLTLYAFIPMMVFSILHWNKLGQARASVKTD